MNVKNVLETDEHVKQIARSCVNQALWLTSAPACIQVEQRILASKPHWFAVRSLRIDEIMPPNVPFRIHRSSLDSHSLIDETFADRRALGEGCVGEGFEADQLASSVKGVGGDQDRGFAVVDSVSKGIGREAGKDHATRFERPIRLELDFKIPRKDLRVNDPEPSTSQHRESSLRYCGQVDARKVALLQSQFLQSIRSLANFGQKHPVSNFAMVSRNICLVDNRDPVRISQRMSVHAIVRDIQTTAQEPGKVSAFRGSSSDGAEGPEPVQLGFCHLKPQKQANEQLIVLIQCIKKVFFFWLTLPQNTAGSLIDSA